MTARNTPGRAALGGVSLDVVVPVRDQPRELRACLDGLFASGVLPDSVIVVDDASTDGGATVAAAEALGVRVVRRPVNGGPAPARNDGAELCRADVIVFVDSDVVVAPDALERFRALFAGDPALGAAFGSYDDAPTAPGTVSRYRNLLHHFVHQNADPEASTFWSGCGAVRRSAFEAVGGFDPARRLNYVEDIDLGARLRRAGYRIRLDGDLRAKHLKRWDLGSFVRTDLLRRALPWSRMMLSGDGLIDDLNVTRGQRLAVALTGVAGLCLPLGLAAPGLWAVGLLAAAGVALINRRLLVFLYHKGGTGFALACLPLHLLHHACAGLGFAWAWLEARTIGLGRHGVTRPQADPPSDGAGRRA